MKLWCHQTNGYNWSEGIKNASIGTRVDVEMFTKEKSVPDGSYVFMRIPQWEPYRSRTFQIAHSLRIRDCKMIPDWMLMVEYENKILQSKRYKGWMPTTHHIVDPKTAVRAALHLGFPFISKTSVSSASKSVRLIETPGQAQREVDLAWGSGIPCRDARGKPGVQTGYLLWQQFIPGNDCDYRVIRLGNQFMMLKRGNRPGTPFASGSGILTPINEPNEHELSALEVAKDFFNHFHYKFCGIDLVFNDTWYVLETTLGWSFDGYVNCRFLGTDRYGKDFFKVFIEELEAGAFE